MYFVRKTIPQQDRLAYSYTNRYKMSYKTFTFPIQKQDFSYWVYIIWENIYCLARTDDDRSGLCYDLRLRMDHSFGPDGYVP